MRKIRSQTIARICIVIFAFINLLSAISLIGIINSAFILILVPILYVRLKNNCDMGVYFTSILCLILTFSMIYIEYYVGIMSFIFMLIILIYIVYLSYRLTQFVD